MADYFISYSKADGQDLAIKLHDKLRAGPPPLDVWLDDRDGIRAGADWGEAIDQAIKSCKALLFVMTPDSVTAQSVASQEWQRALRFKKPVVPILAHAEAIEPFLLQGRQQIAIFDDFGGGLAKLRDHLDWLESADGKLELLKQRRTDLERDLAHGRGSVDRLRVEIQQVQEEIDAVEKAVAHPEREEERIEQDFAVGVSREKHRQQQPAAPATVPKSGSAPTEAPAHFQDRVIETRILGDFLEDDALRLLRVTGRAGSGKTAMVCRALAALERREFPEQRTISKEIHGIAYLGAGPTGDINFANLYTALEELLPDHAADLQAGWVSAVGTHERVESLLAGLGDRRLVVLLDNFEDLIDLESLEIADPEMAEALELLLDAPAHKLKIILTSRIDPPSLRTRQPGRQVLLPLDKGLESPYAENILRALDRDGRVGLRDASDELLNLVRERTLGIPKALEAFYQALASDPYTDVDDLVDSASPLLPEAVVDQLVSEVFHRLDDRAQRVVEGLAVFPQPVIPEAIDRILQPYVPGIDSTTILRRLTSMYFTRHDAGRYWLHPVDRSYALSQIPSGEPSDWRQPKPPFSRVSLQHAGAAYFAAVRIEPERQRSIEDLGPEFAQLELLVASGDYEAAGDVLVDVVDRLAQWGHLRELVRLARLVAGSGDAEVSAPAHALIGQALLGLGSLVESTDELAIALQQGSGTVEVGPLLDWRISYAEGLDGLGQRERAVDELNVVLEATEEAPELVAYRVAALRTLATVNMGIDNFDAAGFLLSEALRIAVRESAIAFTPEDDGDFSIEQVDISDELQVEDPSLWMPVGSIEVSLEDDPETLEDVPLLGIVASQTDGTPDDSTDVSPEEETEVELQAILAGEEIAGIWLSLASVAFYQDQMSYSWAAAVLAEEAYEAIDSADGVADALRLQSIIASEVDDQQAIAIVRQQEQRLAASRAAGDAISEASLVGSLASTYLSLGELDRARDGFRALHEMAVNLDNARLRVIAEMGLARVDWILDDPESAAARVRELLESGHIQDRGSEFDARVLLGDIERDRNRLELAEANYWAARRSIPGTLSTEMTLERALSDIDLRRREYTSAVGRLERVVEMASRLNSPSSMIDALTALSLAYLYAGHTQPALDANEQALALAFDNQLPIPAAAALTSRSQILLDQEDYEGAEEAALGAEQIYTDLNRIHFRMDAIANLLDIYTESDQTERLLATAERGLQVAKAAGDVALIRSAREQIAVAVAADGRHDEAIASMQAIVQEAPDSSRFHGSLGWVLYAAGAYDESIAESQLALELDEASVWVIDNIAIAHLAAGRPSEAEAWYQEIITGRRGGEDLRVPIRDLEKLLAKRPTLERGQELLALLTQAQERLAAAGATVGQDAAASS